jgi:predicted MFS family arabinose efflux permease
MEQARSLWRHADFTLLWSGSTVSQLGTRVGQIAISLLAVNALAATPLQMGLLSAAQNLGIVVVGLPVGAWVDRMRRRRLMVAMDLLRAAVLVTLPLLATAGGLRLAVLVPIVLATSIATAFFDVAHQAYLPTLVGRDLVVEANSKLQASQSIAVLSGPGPGGLLTGLLGAANTVLLTCLSFVASAVLLRRVRATDPRPAPAPDRALGSQIREGLRYVFGDPVLRAIACCTATSNLFMTMILALLVLFLVRDVGLTAAAVGFVVAVSGVGGVAAALTARRWTSLLGQGRTIWLSLLVTQPFALLVPTAHRDARLALFILGWFTVGYGSTVYNIVQVSYRQAMCPDRLLGRVQASNRFLAFSAVPLGSLLGGVLGTSVGPRWALLVAAAGLISSTLWLVASPLAGSDSRLPIGGRKLADGTGRDLVREGSAYRAQGHAGGDSERLHRYVGNWGAASRRAPQRHLHPADSRDAARDGDSGTGR